MNAFPSSKPKGKTALQKETESLSQFLSMAGLLEKLSAVGLSAGYVRRSGLPSWWNDELNEVPAAVLEGAAHIAHF